MNEVNKMKFDLTEITLPEVMQFTPIQTLEGKRTFPVLDLEVVKKHFNKYLEQIDKLLQEAESLLVDSDNANEVATFLGTSAKQILKKIEEERQFYVGEPNAYIKSVNAFVKIFTDKLEKIETLMKSKISQYRAVQEQKRREAELAAKKATEELQKKLDEEAKAKGIEPAKVLPPALPQEPPVTRTETGSSHGRKVWTFEVTEPNYFCQLIAVLNIQWEKMKSEDSNKNRQSIEDIIIKLKAIAPYLVISDKAVRDAIKAGIREIPGIRIYQDERTTFRT